MRGQKVEVSYTGHDRKSGALNLRLKTFVFSHFLANRDILVLIEKVLFNLNRRLGELGYDA